jgi:hypothetical protein
MGVNDIRDRWGRPYKFIFGGDGRIIELAVRSVGPDGRYEEKYYWRGDDFETWQNRQNFFEPLERRITEFQQKLANIPMSEAEFRQQLRIAGITDSMLVDANNRTLYINAEKTSRYWDKVTLETVQVFGEKERVEKRIITPVTQEIMRFTIRGPGRDGVVGNYDDITFMQIVHVLSEQTKDDPKPVTVIKKIKYTANTGSIAGVVTDATGASIPGATVTAKGTTSGISRSTTTSNSGRFLIGALPAGDYSVTVEAANFQRSVISSVPVKANATAEVNVTMEVSGVSAMVEVTSGASLTVDATSSRIDTNITKTDIALLPINTRNAMNLIALQPGAAKAQDKSTPRLREYFPETLLWRPEVVTNADGKAEVKFPKWEKTLHKIF